jgi:hypothetical protein
VGNDGQTCRQVRYLLVGGDIEPHWAERVRVPNAPWCEITIWWNPHVPGTPVTLSSYGGEVWPPAWSHLFESGRILGNNAVWLTRAGVMLLAEAGDPCYAEALARAPDKQGTNHVLIDEYDELEVERVEPVND